MFGFSLQKILVLVAIVAAVWYGFKWVSRLQAARDAEAKAQGKRAAKRRAPGRPSASADDAEDMVQCPVCRAYVQARGASSCGRSDCPY
jgi:uncharacterized protein